MLRDREIEEPLSWLQLRNRWRKSERRVKAGRKGGRPSKYSTEDERREAARSRQRAAYRASARSEMAQLRKATNAKKRAERRIRGVIRHAASHLSRAGIFHRAQARVLIRNCRTIERVAERDRKTLEREALRAEREAQRAASREHQRNLRKAWLADNPDYMRRWRKENRDLVKGYKARREALMRGADAERVTGEDIAAIRRLQRGKCGYCRERLKRTGENVDHIVPLAKGGAHARSNLQLLCPTCNNRKSAKDPVFFAQELGRLL